MTNIFYKYSAFTSNALKEKYAYRFKALMWSLSTLFNMLVQYYLWKSIYEEVNGPFMGVAKGNYLIYISFGVVFYNITSCMENMNIAEDIKSGNISMNLTKPINYKIMVLFRHIGSKAGEAIGLIPLLIVAFLLTNHVGTISGTQFIAFLVSTVLAFFLVFSFSYIIGLVTFWTTNYWGVQFFTNTIMGLFSGQLVAINFYIELGKGLMDFTGKLAFIQSHAFVSFFHVLGIVAYCLPFQSMYYTPMSLLSGMINKPQDIAIHLLLQVFWLVVLNGIICIMWNRAQKKITILGG
ncbi:MAG TPA: hypothetical protein DCW90_19670 [Lachnospiraceae bacterium]|nr:ABC-2 family transporter protein [uncultured Lachnoclostridium sp.]HAU87623.1 hypothetical protein [Lachnospiraceae bacterium]